MASPKKTPFTKEEIAQIEAMASHGLTMQQIADIRRISKDTLERRLKYSPDGVNAIRRGRAVAIANVAQTAYTMANNGKNPAMTMFYLKTRARWRERDRLEVTGKNGKPIDSKMELIVTDARDDET
jgi:hypothetical protein